MDIINKMTFDASKCRVCLSEFDTSAMQALFTNNKEVDKPNADAGDEEPEDTHNDKQPLSSKIEYCCGIRVKPKTQKIIIHKYVLWANLQIRQASHLPSKVCERCCDFISMWFSFRQMCLNSQVYLESTYIHDEKPNDLIDASDTEYMEYLYETLQLATLDRCQTSEALQSGDSPEIESDYVVDYDEENYVADAMPSVEQDDCSKHNMQEILTELETYEANEDVPIEVEPSLIYADEGQAAEVDLPLKVEDCEVDYCEDNDDFLSPTPSPEPQPNNATVKRKPGRPRKSDSELKSKRKNKSDAHSRNEHPSEDVPTKYICNLCGNVYPKKSAFTAHMMAHTDYKPHQCE